MIPGALLVLAERPLVAARLERALCGGGKSAPICKPRSG